MATMACTDPNKSLQVIIPADTDITEIFDTTSLNRPVEVPDTLLPGMTVEVLGITSDEVIGVFMPVEYVQLSVYRTESMFRDLIIPNVGELFFASSGSKIIVPATASRLFFETAYSEQHMDTLDILLIALAGNEDQSKPDTVLPTKTSLVQLEGNSYNEVKPSQLDYGSIVYVEVVYAHVPIEDQLEIRLNWDLNQFRMLTVYRTYENPNLFRSKSIILNNPE